MAAVATRASTTAIRMASTLLCIPGASLLAVPRASGGGKLFDPHRRLGPTRLPRRRVGHERDSQVQRIVEGDGEGPAQDVVGGQDAVADRTDPGLLPDDLPEREAAAEVAPVVDADDGPPGRLTGGVGGLDPGVEGEAELDHPEQQQDQQGKQQRELDRGRALLVPSGHRAPDQGVGAHSEGAGSVATQSPTSVYLVWTALKSA